MKPVVCLQTFLGLQPLPNITTGISAERMKELWGWTSTDEESEVCKGHAHVQTKEK